ncbi:MAG: SMC-Scp complex subunit ScpB [Gammaproteobacteria bacterium]|nr:SMC-Scp complex subunit ScpB [Gammaproteobacteria bacterium]
MEAESPAVEAVNLKPVVEAIVMASEAPVSVERLAKILEDEGGNGPGKDVLRNVLGDLQSDYAERGVELVEVASGFRFQARAAYADRVSRLWEERKPRYSRALLETLALVAYRQPITRGEIEHVRGVAVSSNIMRLLLERDWVKVVGHRDVPGRPAVYATTKEFLDYFGLKSLAELPSLAELKDFDAINADLFANIVLDEEGATADEAATTAAAGGDHASAAAAAESAADGAASETDSGGEVAAGPDTEPAAAAQATLDEAVAVAESETVVADETPATADDANTSTSTSTNGDGNENPEVAS